MGRVLVKPEVCMGCHLCEIWCKVAHSRSKNIFKAFQYEKQAPVSRVIFEENMPVTFPLQCRHCSEPDCVAACISGALYKDPKSGKVLHESSKCVGCYSCVMACPYGNITRDEVNREIKKCDLCDGLDSLYCVDSCPNEALVYVSDEDGGDNLGKV